MSGRLRASAARQPLSCSWSRLCPGLLACGSMVSEAFPARPAAQLHVSTCALSLPWPCIIYTFPMCRPLLLIYQNDVTTRVQLETTIARLTASHLDTLSEVSSHVCTWWLLSRACSLQADCTSDQTASAVGLHDAVQ